MAKGIRSFTRKDGAVRLELRKAGRRGLGLAAEHILGEARKKVPHEEGTLENSGFTAVDQDDLKAVVGFDTPYAVIQHEDMTLRHNEGREAKYLENALNAEKDTAMQIVVKTLAGEL